MKFRTAEGTPPLPSQISRWKADIWGYPAEKTREIAKIANFFAPQGRTPCPMLVKSVGFMRVIGVQKLLVFGAIRLVN